MLNNRLCRLSAILLMALLTTHCSTLQTHNSSTVSPDKTLSNLQLLNRISWGATSSSLQEINHLGANKYLEQQLHPQAATKLPDEINQQIAKMEISQYSLTELVTAAEQERKKMDVGGNEEAKKNARHDYQQHLNSLSQESAQRFILRAIYSPNQLQEQLTWFWLNHFSVLDHKNNIRAMIGDYEDQAIRPKVLGRFRDLLAASVYHPAMLSYLDNAKNTAGHINENYARELMELHTMGVDGGYSQTDVQELARILTGLGINKKPGNHRNKKISYAKNDVVFNEKFHDKGSKNFLGELIHKQDKAEIDEALDRLSRHPATAHFISKKLAVYFMGDNPSPAVIDRMAKTFLAKDGDISATLRTLFYSPEFTASLNKEFKDPIHYVISAARLTYGDQPIDNATSIINWLDKMGEPLYGRQTPDGYALDQASWSSPGQMTTRFEIARNIANSHLRSTPNNADVTKPAAIQDSYYYSLWQHLLSDATQQVLVQAKTPQEWNALFLSSPEFMNR